MESALIELLEEGQADDIVSVIVRLHPGSPPPAQLRLTARFGDIATCRIRRGDIAAVREAVASMKRPQNYTAGDDAESAPASGDLHVRDTDHRRTSDPSTGRGSIVCHLDWGLDFAHPAFRKADGRTRLLGLWDQAARYDPAHPNRFGYGRIFTREEIDRALATRDPHRTLGYRWWSSDRGQGSHGTHTMGISAGRGLADLPAGYAPDADLLFVDLSTRSPSGPQPLGSSTDLLEGVAWADSVADDRPLVINASLGRQAGQHDGLTLTEQALDGLVSARAGRAMTMSCGNYYEKRAHASLVILPGDRRTIGLELAPGDRRSELDLWYPQSDRLLVGCNGPDDLTVAPLGPDRNATLICGGRRVGRLYHRADDPNNGCHQVSLFLDAAAPPGSYSLILDGETVGDGRVHAWVERDPLGESRLRFADADIERRGTLGTICNGFATIAVAAFDGHDRDRLPAPFSSCGPTRDGRSSRPTIAAEGYRILSARSAPRDGSNGAAGSRMSGTSMAAPAVAGTIALMFEAAARPLWNDEIRAILAETADPVPDHARERLGAGYLRAAAAVQASRTIPPRAADLRPHRPIPRIPRPDFRLPTQEVTSMSPNDEHYDFHHEHEAAHDHDACEADSELEEALAIEYDAAELAEHPSMVEEVDGEDEAELVAADFDGLIPEDAEARMRRGWNLPFQIQVPVGGGGGGLGLAVPIGGRSSPFAVSVPLGGAPAPAPAPVSPPAPAAAQPWPPAPQPWPPGAQQQPAFPPAFAPAPHGGQQPEPLALSGPFEPVVTALDLPPAEPLPQATEVAFAAGELVRDVEATPAGELLLEAAEAIEATPDSAEEMTRLLARAIGHGDGDQLGLWSLFRQLAGGQRDGRLFGHDVHVIALPGGPLGPARPRPGDVLLRAFPGQRFVQLSIVARSELVPAQRLGERGLRAEGSGGALPGRYLQVVEPWPVPRRRSDGFARRLANAADLVPLDTLLLRLGEDPGRGPADLWEQEETNPIAAGQLVVQRIPLLSQHEGMQPDLILRWNAIPAETRRVDIVVHLHGFSGYGAAMRIDRDKLPGSGLDFADPTNPATSGRTAPTLCILPRGNFYGGRTHMGYDFPALLPAGALDQLIATSLERFAASSGIGTGVERGRLILTAHSGGGAPLMRLLGHTDPDEVITFDALYGPATALARWAERRIASGRGADSALRVLYRAGEGTAGNSLAVRNALRRLLASNPDLAPRFRVEAVRTSHGDIPRRYGWRLLADAAADVTGGGGAQPPAPAPGLNPAPAPTPQPSPLPGPAPSAHALDQNDASRLAAATFSNSGELAAFFPGGDFPGWFNRELGGRAPFMRPGRHPSPMRMPTAADAARRFNRFWDRVDLAYGRAPVSLLEFATLMAIVLNETSGNFSGRPESAGRGRKDRQGHDHPGLAYFFDEFQFDTGGGKQSYNSGSNILAGRLFNDPDFIRAHGHLGGASMLANHGDDWNGAWNGKIYPQGTFSTSEHAPETAFIREADFCKFRGRGVIQLTFRGNYKGIVRLIRRYTGSDPLLSAKAREWAALTDDQVCTRSSNADWDALFETPEVLGLGFRVHSPDYRFMDPRLDVLLDTPANDRSRGAAGSIYRMGRTISGSGNYGRGRYRDRVLAMLQAMARLPLGSGGQSRPQPSTLQQPGIEPEHPQRRPDPPARPSGSQEPEHPQQRRTPQPSSGDSVRPRGAVAAPDEATARQQWEAHPAAHRHFEHGLADYLRFAPMFAARGVGNAAAWLADNMTMLRFRDRETPGHRAFVPRLAAAEAALGGAALDPPVTSFWSLKVRPIGGSSGTRLSFHSLGLAIDINPRTNPHITSEEDMLVIHAVTGTDLRREINPSRLLQCSRQFQRDFTEDWISGQNDPALVRALRNPGRLERLRGWARTGFCTIDQRLIEALIGAGLTWGGQWRSSKDFMHFELP